MLKVKAIGYSVTEYKVYLVDFGADGEETLSHVGTVRQQKDGDWRAYAKDTVSVDYDGYLTPQIGVFSTMNDAVAEINTFYDFNDGVCTWKYI